MHDGAGDETQAIPLTPGPPNEPADGPTWVLAGRYRVLDRLGSGGMADVFRAHDELLDRDVAVKVFRTPVDEPGNATAMERREIELRALAQLSHPNLITLYDANITAANPAFLVTELVIGPNLATRLTGGPLPEELVRVVGAQLADALAYVHASGMVHRDVKPANILLGADGSNPETAAIRARLSDFGIVRVLEDARMTSAELTLGTAFYLAPEQARGADVTAAADVYSLALVLIEMLTGQRSFDGPMHEAMAARLSRAPDIPAGLPQPWPGLLAAMTRADPASRPSAAEVAESLRMPASASTFAAAPLLAVAPAAAYAAAPGPGAFAAGPAGFDSEPAPAPRRRRGAGMAIAALAFLAVIATAVILITRPGSNPSTPTGGGTTAPTTSAGQPSRGQSAKSGTDAAVPVTAGGSGPSSTAPSSSAGSSAVPSRTRSSTTSATRTSPPPSSSARPSTSAPRSTPTQSSAAPTTSTAATSVSPSPDAPPASGGAVQSGAVGSATP